MLRLCLTLCLLVSPFLHRYYVPPLPIYSANLIDTDTLGVLLLSHDSTHSFTAPAFNVGFHRVVFYGSIIDFSMRPICCCCFSSGYFTRTLLAPPLVPRLSSINPGLWTINIKTFLTTVLEKVDDYC